MHLHKDICAVSLRYILLIICIDYNSSCIFAKFFHTICYHNFMLKKICKKSFHSLLLKVIRMTWYPSIRSVASTTGGTSTLWRYSTSSMTSHPLTLFPWWSQRLECYHARRFQWYSGSKTLKLELSGGKSREILDILEVKRCVYLRQSLQWNQFRDMYVQLGPKVYVHLWSECM